MESIAVRIRSFPTWVANTIGRASLIQLACILSVVLAVHWELLLDVNGYVTWGNFVLPYTNSQYAELPTLPAGWSGFQYMGAPSVTPFTTVITYLTLTDPLRFLSALLGPAGAAKLYAVLSTFFLGAAFLIFCKTIIRNHWGQLVAVLFVLTGPFQLQLYGQGDYLQFVSEAFIFLAIYFLWRALRASSTRWVFYPLSIVALILAIGALQIFALGLLLYASFFVAYVVSIRHEFPQIRARAFGLLAIRLLILPLVLAPLILPLFYAPVSLGPSSPFAPSFSSYSSNSASPLAIFLLSGYLQTSSSGLAGSLSVHMISAVGGDTLAAVWLGLVISLHRRHLDRRNRDEGRPGNVPSRPRNSRVVARFGAQRPLGYVEQLPLSPLGRLPGTERLLLLGLGDRGPSDRAGPRGPCGAHS